MSKRFGRIGRVLTSPSLWECIGDDSNHNALPIDAGLIYVRCISNITIWTRFQHTQKLRSSVAPNVNGTCLATRGVEFLRSALYALSFYLSLPFLSPLPVLPDDFSGTSAAPLAGSSTYLPRNMELPFIPRQLSIHDEIERVPKPCLSSPIEPQSEGVQSRGQNETPGLKLEGLLALVVLQLELGFLGLETKWC